MKPEEIRKILKRKIHLMIYYAEPSVGYDEIKAVNRVLKSKRLHRVMKL